MTGLSERMSDSPTGANSASEGGDALAMLSIDARGRIVAASAAWLAKLGLERRDAIGRDWREFLAPPCRSDVERRVNEALARGGSFAGVPCAWVGESGRRVDALTFGFRDSRLAEEPGAWVMALVETRDRVAIALEASDLSIWEFDALDNRITHDGRSTEKLGLPSKPVYTRREILERMHRADRRGTLRTVAAALSGETARFSLLARLGGADGGWRWLRCDGKVAERGPDGRALRLIGTALDVTAEKATEASIYEMEYIDGLTRLPNRTLFMERLHAAIQEARINRLRFAVLFADLDRFEEINDTQGHEVGEKALAEAARRLASRVRKGDVFARLGGDEFGVLALGVDEGPAMALARRLVDCLYRDKVAVGGESFALGVSVGVAMYPQDGSRPDLLLRNADIAMFRAKTRRLGAARYHSAMSAMLAERLALARDLADALQPGVGDQLQLYFQPQVDMPSGRVVGAEALLRWRHPFRGPIAPDQFLGLAEERGLMPAVGAWVLSQACRQLADWRAAGIEFPGRLAINVAAQELEDPGFFANAAACVAEFGLEADMIELELTESGIMQNAETSFELLQRLDEAGFSIALDDFGAGSSSLARLARLPVARLKICRSFVGDMTESEHGRAIASTIIAIGRTLGIETIAEGVETEAQKQALVALGCTRGQGYRFGRAEPADIFAQRWLIDHDNLIHIRNAS